jgi:Domain of Unknown Function (DUF928)
MHFSVRLLKSLGLVTGLILMMGGPCLAARYIPRVAGLPGRTQGGATRIGVGERQGACLGVKNQVVALVPSDNKGATLMARPTLGFVLPKMEATQVEFRVRDENFNVVYHSTFDVSGSGGVIGVPLGGKGLEEGKSYSWDFALACEGDRSADLRTTGLIHRLAVEGKLAKIAGMKIEERVAVLAQEGVWYDALGGLLVLREGKPQDVKVKGAWDELLRSVGLEP